MKIKFSFHNQLNDLKKQLGTKLRHLDKRVCDVQLMEDERHRTLFEL